MIILPKRFFYYIISRRTVQEKNERLTKKFSPHGHCGNLWLVKLSNNRENTKGEKLDFKNWNKGVIELIDDMDVQIEYIGEYIVNLVGLNKR